MGSKVDKILSNLKKQAKACFFNPERPKEVPERDEARDLSKK
jgi:hypothetical protein